jgi:hypothetical protein
VATISPASVSFASTLVNGNANPVPVTVKNTGTASLTISDVGIAGANASDFGVTSNGCTANGVVLQPGQSCTVNVGFSPTAVGTRAASLVFTDDATTKTQSVALSGAGTAQNPPTVSNPVQMFTEAGMPLQLTVSATLANSTIPIAIRWSQTNAELVDHYVVQYSLNGSTTWTPVTLADKTATSVKVNLNMGTLSAPQTYQFRVQGYGTPTGQIGAWATGPKFSLLPIDDTVLSTSNPNGILYKGTWTTETASSNPKAPTGSYNNTIHWSATSATATLNAIQFSVTGNAAWVSTLGPDRGLAQVQVDNGKATVVDLYAASVQAGKVVWAVDNLAAGTTHTVTITVLGKLSPNNPNPKSTACTTGTKCARVDIDAFVVLK